MVTGRNIAATPTLFMIADSPEVLLISTASRRPSPLPARRSTWLPRALATPVRASPSERMNTAQMVTTAGLAKPAMPSSGLTRPRTTSATSTSRPTRSARRISVTKSTMAMPRIAKVTAMSRLTARSPPRPAGRRPPGPRPEAASPGGSPARRSQIVDAPKEHNLSGALQRPRRGRHHESPCDPLNRMGGTRGVRAPSPTFHGRGRGRSRGPAIAMHHDVMGYRFLLEGARQTTGRSSSGRRRCRRCGGRGCASGWRSGSRSAGPHPAPRTRSGTRVRGSAPGGGRRGRRR